MAVKTTGEMWDDRKFPKGPTPRARQLIGYLSHWIGLHLVKIVLFLVQILMLCFDIWSIYGKQAEARWARQLIGYLSQMYLMSYFGTHICIYTGTTNIAVFFYFWNIDGTWASHSGVSKSFVRNICPCKKLLIKNTPIIKKKLASEPSL